MQDRTKQLLLAIIREHIKTAQPVGSSVLVEKCKLNISPATVRNEMMALEESGYITQPHTSAGRVPTEKGYQFFVDNFVAASEPGKKSQQILAEILKQKQETEILIKNFAKELAELSGGLVFVGFAPFNTYYTGLSNILSQPEFAEQNVIYDFGRLVDSLDTVLTKLFVRQASVTEILIGSKNLFGNNCSAVVGSFKYQKNNSLFGIVGPLRMDYEENLNLLNFTRELINKIS